VVGIGVGSIVGFFNALIVVLWNRILWLMMAFGSLSTLPAMYSRPG
jgi:hypothetical protein